MIERCALAAKPSADIREEFHRPVRDPSIAEDLDVERHGRLLLTADVDELEDLLRGVDRISCRCVLPVMHPLTIVETRPLMPLQTVGAVPAVRYVADLIEPISATCAPKRATSNVSTASAKGQGAPRSDMLFVVQCTLTPSVASAIQSVFARV